MNDLIKEISPQGHTGAPGGAKELLSRLKQSSMETWSHSIRVGYYCQRIGNSLDFSCRELRLVSVLSMFHDIGKLGIRPAILQKPEKLTAAEWQEIKRHPEIGYRLTAGVPEISKIAGCVLGHHERWDGLGYPQGLKEETIPLFCRILAVADAFDAMTCDRVYRKALGREQAVSELRCNAGRQFDPRIVQTFVGILAGYPAS